MSAQPFHRPRALQGQAATELAVFGAILIFLIGSIVRSSVGNSYQQNQQLKSMRYALLQSYRGTQAQSAGRNTATILYIEDRLTPDLSKYGPGDRSLSMSQASGTMSNMLMYPLDLEDLQDEKNIPVMDVYINGKHFMFSTARLMKDKPIDPPKDGGGTPYLPSYAALLDPAGNGTNHYKGWNFNCVVAGGLYYGCPIFYQLQINDGSFDPGMLSADEAYDLNRNDNFTDDPVAVAAPGKLVRSSAAWYWKGTNGLQANIKIDAANANYPLYDMDYDKQEETLYTISASPKGVITAATVFDFQDGDLNLSADTLVNNRSPGLQTDMAMYTKTNPGTYLSVKEGKLYNSETGTFVRSVGFRDQAEIVQRLVQLSNDTGRLCKSGAPVAPVEACGECFSTANIKLTCFEPTSKRLIVRSRLLDKSGHKWKTDVESKLP